MENPMVNYAKIVEETNSRHYNVRDEYKENTYEQNVAITLGDQRRFSVGIINITGELNVGMMIRSACLFGAEKFYIFGRKKFDKRSTVGAEKYIDIVQYTYDAPIDADESILADLRTLKDKHSIFLCEHGGYTLGKNNHKMLYGGRPNPLFVFGSESHGIPNIITEQKAIDGYPEWEFDRISIPQRGVLRSFNVSSAMSIICWDYVKETHL